MVDARHPERGARAPGAGRRDLVRVSGRATRRISQRSGWALWFGGREGIDLEEELFHLKQDYPAGSEPLRRGARGGDSA